MHGLNLYDYSARYYESAIGRFTTVDPLAEKYYSISPYVYCGNNPLRFIDPTGMFSEEASIKRDIDQEVEAILRIQNSLRLIDDRPVRMSFKDDPPKNNGQGAKVAQIAKDAGNLTSLASAKGVTNYAAKSALSVFAKKENAEGGGIRLVARTYENSAPDYLGGYTSVSAPLALITSTEFEVNVGYIKNKGWVMFATKKTSPGINVSLGGGLTAGQYVGVGKPTSESMAGEGTFFGVSMGSYNIEYSRGYSQAGAVSWHFISSGYGTGIYTNWSMAGGITETSYPVSLGN